MSERQDRQKFPAVFGLQKATNGQRFGIRVLVPIFLRWRTAYNLWAGVYERGWWKDIIVLEFESFPSVSGFGFAIKFGLSPTKSCRPFSNKHNRYMRPEEYV